MAELFRVEKKLPEIKPRKRVAAYARVSVETERLSHSLSTQISYYSTLIQNNPEWEYVGVFADNGISGTRIQNRTEFQNMIALADKGLIDIILTKSIQRFARNTVDLLKTVRHLKSIGVDVRFEKENFSSMNKDGELMLSILASFAQEESRSISENIKWSVRKKFSEGIADRRFQVYGYRWDGEQLVIQEDEAQVVRLIFSDYLNGLSADAIEKKLGEMGIKSAKGQHFSKMSIRSILRNVTYTGNLLFQRWFVDDPITGRRKLNRGELPQYWVENSHEAIISVEDYEAVQMEKARRQELGAFANTGITTSCFTSKIKCGVCGKSYRRHIRHKKKGSEETYCTWICRTKDEKGARACSGKRIPESALEKATVQVLALDCFDAEAFDSLVDKVVVLGDDTLEFHLSNGSIQSTTWKSTAVEDWWTPERRAECSRLRSIKQTSISHKYEFAGFIRCEKCGSGYTGIRVDYVNGERDRRWHCKAWCGNTAIKGSTLRKMVSDVLGTSEYSENQMDSILDGISILDSTATFKFKDGRTETRSYKEEVIRRERNDK